MKTFEEVQDYWIELLKQFENTTLNDPFDQGYEMAFIDALEWVMQDD